MLLWGQIRVNLVHFSLELWDCSPSGQNKDGGWKRERKWLLINLPNHGTAQEPAIPLHLSSCHFCFLRLATHNLHSGEFNWRSFLFSSIVPACFSFGLGKAAPAQRRAGGGCVGACKSKGRVTHARQRTRCFSGTSLLRSRSLHFLCASSSTCFQSGLNQRAYQFPLKKWPFLHNCTRGFF